MIPFLFYQKFNAVKIKKLASFCTNYLLYKQRKNRGSDINFKNASELSVRGKYVLKLNIFQKPVKDGQN